MSLMNKPASNQQALRTQMFLAAIAVSVVAVLFGSYFAFGVLNGIPLSTMTAHIGDAFGVLFALALLVAFIKFFPRLVAKVNLYLDQQGQIAALVEERNAALASAAAAEQASAAAAEQHTQEMADTRAAHAMSISTMEDRHVAVIKRMLKQGREEKRTQQVAWHKGYTIVVAERDRARQQVESLQAAQERKLLAKADDLTALILAAVQGNLTRASVQVLVPIANGAYGKWSANLQTQIQAVLATSVEDIAPPSATLSSPTPQTETVAEQLSPVETTAPAIVSGEGDTPTGTATAILADDSADQPPA